MRNGIFTKLLRYTAVLEHRVQILYNDRLLFYSNTYCRCMFRMVWGYKKEPINCSYPNIYLLFFNSSAYTSVPISIPQPIINNVSLRCYYRWNQNVVKCTHYRIAILWKEDSKQFNFIFGRDYMSVSVHILYPIYSRYNTRILLI